jgi:hypothetical protein
MKQGDTLLPVYFVLRCVNAKCETSGWYKPAEQKPWFRGNFNETIEPVGFCVFRCCIGCHVPPMSTEYYNAQVSKTLKDWWVLNNDAVRVCLNATALGEGEGAKTAIAAVSISRSPSNPRYAQIDRRTRSELGAIDHMVAPEPIKKEVRNKSATPKQWTDTPLTWVNMGHEAMVAVRKVMSPSCWQTG